MKHLFTITIVAPLVFAAGCRGGSQEEKVSSLEATRTAQESETNLFLGSGEESWNLNDLKITNETGGLKEDRTNNPAVLREKIALANETLKGTALSSKLPETVGELTNALTEILRHATSAKASRQEFSNRPYSNVPVEGGRLSFSFFGNKDGLEIKEVSKRTTKNEFIYRIRFNQQKRVESAMIGDETIVHFFDNGAIRSYAATIDGKAVEVEWDQDGSLISRWRWEQGPDGRMRRLQDR